MKTSWLSFFNPPRICFETPGESSSGGETPPVVETPLAGETPPATPSLLSAGEGETPPDGEGETPPAGEETPPGEGETPPAPVPVTMENITLPEGIDIPEDSREEFLGFINDAELSRADLVTKLIGMQAESLTAAAQAPIDAWTTLREGWQTEARALPEIGGDKLEGSLADIKRGLDAAGATKEAYEALDVTGAGDNPHLIQMMHKLVQPFLEKAPPPGDPTTIKADLATRMYPSMNKE